MEKLKEEHEKGLMTSVIFLKKLLELARDTVAAVKKANATQPEPTREEKGKAALTELLKKQRMQKPPSLWNALSMRLMALCELSASLDGRILRQDAEK